MPMARRRRRSSPIPERFLATGGSVMMTARAARSVENNVINNTGTVEATSASVQNGEVILDAGADGTVNDSGAIDASGKQAGETGGKVAITAAW